MVCVCVYAHNLLIINMSQTSDLLTGQTFSSFSPNWKHGNAHTLSSYTFSMLFDIGTMCALSKLILGCCKPFFTFCYAIYVVYSQDQTIDCVFLCSCHSNIFLYMSHRHTPDGVRLFWMLHLSMYNGNRFSSHEKHIAHIRENSISYPLNRAIFNKLITSISHTWALLSLTTLQQK